MDTDDFVVQRQSEVRRRSHRSPDGRYEHFIREDYELVASASRPRRDSNNNNRRNFNGGGMKGRAVASAVSTLNWVPRPGEAPRATQERHGHGAAHPQPLPVSLAP